MLKIQFYEQNGRRVVALAVAGGEWSTVYWDNLPRCIQVEAANAFYGKEV